MKRTLKIRPRNAAARALREPQYRKQVVRMKTTYTRKGHSVIKWKMMAGSI